MKLQIWDTAGQEHFRSVTRSYFRNAAGCLLVYDVTRRSTFLHLKDWLDDIRSQADDDISICLVGNKSDLIEQNQDQDGYNTNTSSIIPSSNNNDNNHRRKNNTNNNSLSNNTTSSSSTLTSSSQSQRQVSYQEAKKWAQENKIFTFVETSAKTGDNVVEAYLNVANDIYHKIVSGKYDLNDRTHGIKASGNKRTGTMINLSMDAAQDSNRNKKNGTGSQGSSCC